MTGQPRRRRFAIGIVAASLLLAACSGTAPAVSTAPSASATATPARTAAPSVASPTQQESRPGEGGYTIGEPLAPGTYSSEAFATPTQFTVPAGWKVFEDEAYEFGLAILANDGPCICFWRDVSLMSASCAFLPEQGVATTAAAIAEGLANRPGIAPTEITPVTVGGLSGVWLDVVLDPAWTQGCGSGSNAPEVPMLVGRPGGVVWSVDADTSQRLYLLDLDPATSGTNLAINVVVCCGVDFQQRMDAVAPVIETLAFGG
jgi:hypothetical protein